MNSLIDYTMYEGLDGVYRLPVFGGFPYRFVVWGRIYNGCWFGECCHLPVYGKSLIGLSKFVLIIGFANIGHYF